jgi:hypothetical protein
VTEVARKMLPQASSLGVRTRIDSEQDAETRWREFQEKFGEKLSPAFTADHRLVRVRAGDDSAKPLDRFSSGDTKAAMARAQDILKEAGDLLGLNPNYPLEPRAVRSDEISSQVEWVQTYRGVPIEPFGRVTLQLDSGGGIHGLYSNYISDPTISNSPSLSADSARASALANLGFTPDRPLNAGAPPAGELILFARGPQDSSQSVELKYAYRYWVSGREVIVDAARGEILSEKDRRQF